MKPVFVITILLAGSLLASVNSHALSLQESFELAQQSDPEIISAKAEYEAAAENIPQARSVLLPQISLDVFVGNSEQITSNASGGFYSDGTEDNDSQGYRLTIDQTLYNHQFYKSLDQAKASVAQAAAFYSAQQQQLLVRVAEQYFDVLAAEDSLRFAIAEKKAVAKQLEQTKKRFEVGLIAITDVKEAQAQFDLTAAQEIAARNQLDTSKEVLQVTINQPVDQLSGLNQQFPLDVPSPNNVGEWTRTAEQQNLGIKAASYALEAAQAGKNASRAGHYPSLSLQATQSDSEFDGSSGIADQEDTTISINLNIPLYAGGATSSKSRQAGFQLRQAQSNLELQKRLARQQTRSAFLGLNAAIASVKALKQALISNQTAVEATTAGFEVGTRTSVDVLNALRNQYRAERDYAQSRYDYLINRLKLKQAAGVLDKADIETINQWFKQ